MTDDQPGPQRRTLTAAYRQAGYTIENPPDFDGADAPSLWVTRDAPPIAIITCPPEDLQPDVLLTKADHHSRHTRIHIVTRSRGRASRVQAHLRNPVQTRTDCGVQHFHRLPWFVLDGTRRATSEPYIWLVTSGNQSLFDRTVLSAPAPLENQSGDGSETSVTVLNQPEISWVYVRPHLWSNRGRNQ